MTTENPAKPNPLKKVYNADGSVTLYGPHKVAKYAGDAHQAQAIADFATGWFGTEDQTQWQWRKTLIVQPAEKKPSALSPTPVECLDTNIKGLPAGHYFTEIGYSQSYPWVEISRTAKSVTIAKVKVKPDPDWVPTFHTGGFAAHCSNQSEQTWVYDGVDLHDSRTIRLTKRGWALGTVRFVEGRAREFYDYNF